MCMFTMFDTTRITHIKVTSQGFVREVASSRADHHMRLHAFSSADIPSEEKWRENRGQKRAKSGKLKTSGGRGERREG